MFTVLNKIETGLVRTANTVGMFNYLSQIKYNFLYTTPWKQLPQDFKKELLFGFYKGGYIGVINDLEKRYKTTHSSYIREWIERFMNTQHCSLCKGARLKQESLSVFIKKNNIATLCDYSITDLLKYFIELKLKSSDLKIASDIFFSVEDNLFSNWSNHLILSFIDFLVISPIWHLSIFTDKAFSLRRYPLQSSQSR